MKQKQSLKSLLAVDSLDIELYGMITQKGILSYAVSNGTETNQYIYITLPVSLTWLLKLKPWQLFKL